jgi:hypothetical protein
MDHDEMNIGTAYGIVMNIAGSRDAWPTDVESILEAGEAVRMVLDLETHNGITKDQILNVCRWLWNMCFEEAEKNNPLTMDDLLEMDGEPVWVKRPGRGAGWELVDVSWKYARVVYLVNTAGGHNLADVELKEGAEIYRWKPEGDYA